MFVSNMQYGFKLEVWDLTSFVQALEGQHGSLLCLGHLIGLILANRRQGNGDLVIEDMETDENEDNDTKNQAIQKALTGIGNVLLLDFINFDIKHH